jgi:hypothetical protein
MAFDFKKEFKELYMPKSKPVIVTVPRANYICPMHAKLRLKSLKRSSGTR